MQPIGDIFERYRLALSAAFHIGPEQIAYFQKILRQYADVRWTMVFLHEPLWREQLDTGWAAMEQLLGDRNYTVFAGHAHEYFKARRNGHDYFVFATTGATYVPPEAGQVPDTDPEFGHFHHVVWVTMTDRGPKIANLLLEGILPDNVRDEAKAERNATLFRNSYVSMGPLYDRGGPFSGGETTVLFVNSGDIDEEMSVDLVPDGPLTLLPSRIVRRLRRGTIEQVPVSIRADKPIAEGTPFGIRLDYVIRCEPKGRPTMSVKRTTVGGPTRLWEVKPSPRPITVDGRLDDWDELPLVVDTLANFEGMPRNWKGADDCSYRFGVSYDDTYLYIAVRTRDDVTVVAPPRRLLEQDYVEIMVDGRDEPLRSANGRRNPFRDYLQLFLTPSPEGGPGKLWDTGKRPEGILAACRKDALGLTAEVGVPISYLSKLQGGDWKAVRINVAVNDFDPGEDYYIQLLWQPRWTGLTVPGSGTFLRVGPSAQSKPAEEPRRISTSPSRPN